MGVAVTVRSWTLVSRVDRQWNGEWSREWPAVESGVEGGWRVECSVANGEWRVSSVWSVWRVECGEWRLE